MARIFIGWQELMKLPIRIDAAGKPIIDVMGTTGEDTIVIDCPLASMPPEAAHLRGIHVGVKGGAGSDRLAQSIGESGVDVSWYGDNGNGTQGGKAIGNIKSGSGDLLQFGPGDRWVGGPGADEFDAHGTGMSYRGNPARLVLNPDEDILNMACDEGLDVFRFTFRDLDGKPGGMQRLQNVTVRGEDSHWMTDGQEVLISIANRPANGDVADPVILYTGNGSRAHQEIAAQRWIDDGMSPGGDVDQWIF